MTQNGKTGEGGNPLRSDIQNDAFDTESITQAPAAGKDGSIVDLSKEPWIWRKALMRADLPASAFRVAIAILDVFMNKKTGTCFPSQDTLADETKLSLSGVRKGLSALRAAGFLSTAKRKFNGSLHYMLAIPVTSRSIPNGVVREHSELPQMGHTNYPIWDIRTAPFGAVEVTHLGHLTLEDNIGTELENVTSDHPSSCDPDGCASGGPSACSPYGRTPSSLSALPQALSRDLLIEEEIVIDETRLRDENYLWRWLNQHVPDKSEWPTIMNLGRAGELSPRHLRSAAS